LNSKAYFAYEAAYSGEEKKMGLFSVEDGENFKKMMVFD